MISSVQPNKRESGRTTGIFLGIEACACDPVLGRPSVAATSTVSSLAFADTFEKPSSRSLAAADNHAKPKGALPRPFPEQPRHQHGQATCAVAAESKIQRRVETGDDCVYVKSVPLSARATQPQKLALSRKEWAFLYTHPLRDKLRGAPGVSRLHYCSYATEGRS